MTKSEHAAMADKLIQEFLKKGGTITQVPPISVKIINGAS
jgi:hypothetical protein